MRPTIAERLAEMEEGIRKSIRSAEGDVRGTRHLAWELASASWADELAAIRAEVEGVANIHWTFGGPDYDPRTMMGECGGFGEWLHKVAARLAPEHPDCDSCGGHGWLYEKDEWDVDFKTQCVKCNGGGKL